MQIDELIAQVKALSNSSGNKELAALLADLELQVHRLVHERTAAVERCATLQADCADRLRRIRHDIAQPLTTIQFFLDLLPAALQQEQLTTAKFVNQNYWTKTYDRAQRAVKTVPQILRSETEASENMGSAAVDPVPKGQEVPPNP